MKKLIFLISTKGKSKEQISQEAMKALRKYRRVESQVRFRLKLNRIWGIIKVVLVNNFPIKQLKRSNQARFQKTLDQKSSEEWAKKVLVPNLRRNLEAQRKQEHNALADSTAKEMGENLRRNVEAQKNDPDYKAPI